MFILQVKINYFIYGHLSLSSSVPEDQTYYERFAIARPNEIHQVESAETSVYIRKVPSNIAISMY